jgi:Tfp pilus assembly protein PilF
VIVKLVSRWGDGLKGRWHKLSGYGGGFVGSLFLGFGKTFWGNAVEAEVYGLGLMLMMLILYLGLLWMEKKGSVKGDRILVLIAYLGLLSIGIHMTVFLVMPVIFLLVIWEDRSKLKDFRFWIAGLILSLVMVTLEPFLILLVGWLVVGFVVLWVKMEPRWVLSFSLILVALVGYSVQGYIPIRSSLNPAIDENNPDNWERFKYFLERKQYGQQSMVERMFTRRGSWSSQFGAHPRMGFWGFFREQYMDKSFWIIPVLLGGLGLWGQLSQRRREGGVLLFLVLLSTVGLVLYMNFSDGTRYDSFTRELIRLEVRDRDYFFTPGFVFFALLMGLGVSQVIRRASEFKNWLGYGAMAVLLISPVTALNKNYQTPNNRRGNYIPYVYAYNILNSCDPDAILFTAGDNDTFPLWFAQEVEGIRKDVRVVNLSLLNSDWYILQLKNGMGVPVDLSYDQIKCVETKLPNGGVIQRPAKPFVDPLRNEERYLYLHIDKKTRSLVRVQDMMIERIILDNSWKYPVYFSTTVPASNRVGLENHLRMEGMALKVVPEEDEGMIDPEKTHSLLWNVYRYDSVNDPGVEKDETTINMLAYVAERFIDLAMYYSHNGEKEKAVTELKKAIELTPYYHRPYILLSQIYKDSEELDKEKEVLNQGAEYLEKLIIKRPEVVTYKISLGFLYHFQRELQKAEEVFRQAFELDPKESMIQRSLFNIYISTRQLEKARWVLKRWLRYNPHDQEAINTLDRLNELK